MADQLKDSLQILQRLEGVRSVVLTGRDGLVIEHIAKDIQTDPAITGAMTAGMFGMIAKSMQRIGGSDNALNSEMNQVLMELAGAKVIAVNVLNGILSIITTGDVNLGLLRLHVNKTAKQVSLFMKEFDV